jgi:phenylalanyl-tRNA synthetase beta chain
MQVPLSWLQTHFEAPLELSELVDRLTLSGIEVEHVQPVGARDPRVVVAEILTVTPLAAGVSRLVLAVDRERTLVSGAPGLSVGDRVALALPGALLFSATEGLHEVAEQRLRGVASEGALVHALDLGLGRDSENPVRVRKGAENGAPALSFL